MSNDFTGADLKHGISLHCRDSQYLRVITNLTQKAITNVSAIFPPINLQGTLW